jgi:hypothetical protein
MMVGNWCGALQPKELRRRDIELRPIKGEGFTAIVHHGVMVDPATRKPREVAVKVRGSGGGVFLVVLSCALVM